jgi:hypothetical protein
VSPRCLEVRPFGCGSRPQLSTFSNSYREKR